MTDPQDRFRETHVGNEESGRAHTRIVAMVGDGSLDVSQPRWPEPEEVEAAMLFWQCAEWLVSGDEEAAH